MWSKPILLAFVLLVAISVVSGYRRVQSHSKVLSKSRVLKAEAAFRVAQQNCGCSWASSSACGSNDGTVCNQVCCAPYRSSPKAPAPAPPVAAPSSSCVCSWASASACGSNDGSTCNQVCCAPFRGSSPVAAPPSSGAAGSAVTTRYWDCCKPACAWPANVPGGVQAVRSCTQNGMSTAPQNAPNACGGGGSAGGPNYICNDQQPFTYNGVLYGFAASNVACCGCYQLTFTNTALAGRTMIVQVTNKGSDLGASHFDLMIPGGGQGIFSGCNTMYGSWNGGAQYGGITSGSQCSALPAAVQAGCNWRFNDFMNADNPNANFVKIACPTILSARSGCSA